MTSAYTPTSDTECAECLSGTASSGGFVRECEAYAGDGKFSESDGASFCETTKAGYKPTVDRKGERRPQSKAGGRYLRHLRVVFAATPPFVSRTTPGLPGEEQCLEGTFSIGGAGGRSGCSEGAFSGKGAVGCSTCAACAAASYVTTPCTTSSDTECGECLAGI